eukprot:NODE_2645_length_2173_cov_10.986804.p1 GENE.NODE_2645_length_2173_cov_10.986804~~NODE_2645_length_2173_cov_10.986804.p1  ORF type:complete len:675 (+),score=54.11 NODE_2645_length_2173_cov_10.986804:36-2060(+)
MFIRDRYMGAQAILVHKPLAGACSLVIQVWRMTKAYAAYANLTAAIDKGDLAGVSAITDSGVAEASISWTVALAARRNHLDIMRHLFEKHANIEGLPEDKRDDAVKHAALHNNVDMMRLLIEHHEPNFKNDVLHLAVRSEHPDMIRLLIENHADIQSDTCLQHALLEEASSLHRFASIRVLLESHADVRNFISLQGAVLRDAIALHDDALVCLLFENLANIQSDPDLQHGLLLHACDCKALASMRTLLENRANVQSHTSLEFLSTAIAENDDDLVRLLFENHADIQTDDELQRDVLKLVGGGSKMACMRLLFENQADVRSCTSLQDVLLPTAIAENNCDLVRLLLKNRASVDGNTSFLWQSRGHREMAALLGEAGAQLYGKSWFVNSYRGLILMWMNTSERTMLETRCFKRFSSTSYLKAYTSLAPDVGTFEMSVQELCDTMQGVVDDFIASNPNVDIDQPKRDDFVQRMRHACVKPGEDSRQLVERSWTCAETCDGNEFCHMANYLICMDTHIEHVVKFSRMLNTFCVTGVSRGHHVEPTQWPADYKTYRAGGLPKKHMAFFRPGVKYRVPRVLPTSFVYIPGFSDPPRQPHPPVKWTVNLPRSKQCHQANYVTNRADGVGDEREFLFAAYSVFEVQSVVWSTASSKSPHEIFVDASADNSLEPDDLPCAPWS